VRIAPGLAGVVAAAGAYSLIEPRRMRLTRHTLELDHVVPPLTILHISDTHLRAGARRVKTFVEGLPGLLGEVPDLVLATGDIIEDDSGIDLAVAAFSRLEARLGLFYVLGSHDYFQSKWGSPTKYLTGARSQTPARPADSPRLEEGLKSHGWRPLTNTTTVVTAGEDQIRLTGVDDPYIKRHRTDHIKRSADDAVAIGLMHAPDVVSEYVLAGYDLVLAGHTHAGQVRLPVVGALVTNCTLPTRLAGGAHKVGGAWLHVSVGLGTSKFTPIRFGARPEATLLTLRGPTSSLPLPGELRQT